MKLPDPCGELSDIIQLHRETCDTCKEYYKYFLMNVVKEMENIS